MSMNLVNLYTMYETAPNLKIYKEILASSYKVLGGKKNTGRNANEPIMWMVEAIKFINTEIEKSKGEEIETEEVMTSVSNAMHNALEAANKYGYKHAGSRVSHEGTMFVTLKLTGKGVEYTGRIPIDFSNLVQEHAIYGIPPIYGIYIYAYQHIVRIAELMYIARGFGTEQIEGLVFSFLPEIIAIMR